MDKVKSKLGSLTCAHTCEEVLTKCCLVQEVQLCVERLQLWVTLLDDADNEVQQRLFAVCRFGVQQLGGASKE